MHTNHQNRQEKDKKKAKRFAFWFHSILLVGFAFPFLTQTETKAPKYEQVVSIDFKDFKSASAKSSTQKANPATTKTTVKKPKPVEKPKPVTEPKVTPVKTAPRKPVLTTPEPKAPVFKEAPVVDAKPTPVPEVKTSPKTTSKTSDTTPATTGKASETGEGKSGSSDKGDAPTDGKADKGDDGLDFSGDGLFTRRVTYRADVKQLTKEEGKIVINLCVNQQGRVIYTDFNKDESTISNMPLIREAMQATQAYRFEKDYTAPRKQCGKLSFIFEIEEE